MIGARNGNLEAVYSADYRAIVYTAGRRVILMAQTGLGTKAEEWSASAKKEFRSDLDQLTGAPPEVLRSVADKIAKTYPACNTTELAALAAEQHNLTDPQQFIDAVSAFVYVWDNMDSDLPQAVVSDLLSLELISDSAAPLLIKLLESAVPFRESAKAAAQNLRLGSPLFVGLRGTVDIKLRFHKKEENIWSTATATELVGVQQVVMANLTISQPDGTESVIPFLMDETDLSYMKRFVRNMERELELSRGLVSSMEAKR
jgi:hypothetical protein